MQTDFNEKQSKYRWHEAHCTRNYCSKRAKTIFQVSFCPISISTIDFYGLIILTRDNVRRKKFYNVLPDEQVKRYLLKLQDKKSRKNNCSSWGLRCRSRLLLLSLFDNWDVIASINKHGVLSEVQHSILYATWISDI